MEFTRSAIREKLEMMANSPKVQAKRLAIGTFISIISMMALLLTSEYEAQWLFYTLSFILMVGILYAIPGYLGIWLWRMKDTFFKK